MPLWVTASDATGEPDRVYLYHCKAYQRRTGTAFHFGATFVKERVRLDGERKSTNATPTVIIAFGFISARTAARRSIGEEIAILRSAVSRSARSTRPPFPRLAIRFGRSRYIPGLAYLRKWIITAGPTTDHLKT